VAQVVVVLLWLQQQQPMDTHHLMKMLRLNSECFQLPRRGQQGTDIPIGIVIVVNNLPCWSVCLGLWCGFCG
jgi:hypothetical protein